MNGVDAELEAVIAVAPIEDVADLPFPLVGIGLAVLIVG